MRHLLFVLCLTWTAAIRAEVWRGGVNVGGTWLVCKADPGRRTIEIPDLNMHARFSGTRHGDHIVGTATIGGKRVPMQLRAAGDAPIDPSLSGEYELSSGRWITVDVNRNSATVVDVDDGKRGFWFRAPHDSHELVEILPLSDADLQPRSTRARMRDRGTLSTLERGAWTTAKRLPLREDVTFTNGDVRLAGTIYKPLGTGKHPAIVFLQGAGRATRMNFQFLAPMLAKHGIVALWFDKRGSGQSSGNYERATYDDLASDGAAALRLLATLPIVDSTRMGVLGHSEGSWVAPLIAAKAPDLVRFVVLSSGVAVPPYVQEIAVLPEHMHVDGFSTAEIEEAKDLIGLQYEVAAGADRRWPELQQRVAAAKQKAWGQEFGMTATRDELESARLTSFHDPAQSLRAIMCPVLVLLGDRDVFVPTQISRAAYERAFTESKNANHTIVMIPSMGHGLTVMRTGSERERFESPGFSPVYLSTLRQWLELNAMNGNGRDRGTHAASFR